VDQIFNEFRSFSVDDFVTHQFFREWVINPTEEHEDFWNAFQAHYPEKSTILQESRELVLALEAARFEMNPAEKKQVWEGIQQNIKFLPKHLKVSQERRPYLTVAASFAAVLLITFGIYYYQQPEQITYVTGYGETKEIILPDSSKVILNANSQLSFINNWEGQTAREINIEGEAFFDVVHKVDHQPFKVFSSQGVSIEVLGTEFNVYNRSEETEVVLSSGLVTLSFPVKEKEGKIVMNPGDLVEFKESKYQRKQVNTSLYTSWKDNILNLDETSLEEIIKMAKNNYGIEVEVMNSSALKQTASGSMPLGDAENFMEQISKIFNIEIEQEQSKYLIK